MNDVVITDPLDVRKVLEAVLAAHHRETLVPASILMALIGYAVGNYLAILTGQNAQAIGS